MAKVFTITPGLENMGAMKTGGQGSVYKGRRISEIVTAIKLLPTPIFSESEDDKNYRDFKNEVEKLKRVNREPNANVVKILSSGLSETGNFPFIEMEYIEGPDLEELLKPPHDPVFSIKEVIKVAEHLSNALAHCHRNDVKHGDIKSNNVKFNVHTGNYVLLDFGLAAMSDEQRRTSLRHAGAVEFMAPEQNEGEMLFQTDVYSFGVILFELLAGRVPFPLHDKGETARNTVRLAHIETPVPDIVALRQELLPSNWSAEKRNNEMNIPDWLTKMIYKCLEKNSESRFNNGTELHDYVTYNITHSIPEVVSGQGTVVSIRNERSSIEKEQLQQQLLQYRQQLNLKEKEINELKAIAANKDEQVQRLRAQSGQAIVSEVTEQKGVSNSLFILLLLLTIGLATYTAYSFFKNSNNKSDDTSTVNNGSNPVGNSSLGGGTPAEQENTNQEVTEDEKPAKEQLDTPVREQPPKIAEKKPEDQTSEPETSANTSTGNEQPKAPETVPNVPVRHQYMVVSKAYFYNDADEATRRNIFIIPSNNAIVEELEQKDDFVYVLFTNNGGQQFKGWLRKKDLQPLNE